MGSLLGMLRGGQPLVIAQPPVIDSQTNTDDGTGKHSLDGPVPLIRVELKQGHEVGKLPCTRNCIFDVSRLPPGVSIPECVQETLLHVDPVARLIYYNMEGEGPFGLRNYLATTEVDELGPMRTRVTCTGRFDLPEGVPDDMVKTSVIESVYASIIRRIAAMAIRDSQAAPAGGPK